jgi:hypothetical protein
MKLPLVSKMLLGYLLDVWLVTKLVFGSTDLLGVESALVWEMDSKHHLQNSTCIHHKLKQTGLMQ